MSDEGDRQVQQAIVEHLVCAFMQTHDGSAHLVQAAIAGKKWALRFFCEHEFLDMCMEERFGTKVSLISPASLLAAFDYLGAFVPSGCESGTVDGPSSWWKLSYALADAAFRLALGRDDIAGAMKAWNRLAALHPGTRTHRRVVTLDKVLKGESPLSALPPPQDPEELPALLQHALAELPLLHAAHGRAEQSRSSVDPVELLLQEVTSLRTRAGVLQHGENDDMRGERIRSQLLGDEAAEERVGLEGALAEAVEEARQLREEASLLRTQAAAAEDDLLRARDGQSLCSCGNFAAAAAAVTDCHCCYQHCFLISAPCGIFYHCV